MDQTNPLAELTQQASSLGARAGRPHARARGLRSPRRALLAVRPHVPDRDAGRSEHRPDHSRSRPTRAINDLGFIETPYRVVKNGKVTDEIALARRERRGGLRASRRPTRRSTPTAPSPRSWCSCRKGDDYPLLPPDRIDFMDVAPEQLVSIAAALIPFLEHDDANRALMGSNMQRQAVPLLYPQAPLVGTGLEEKVAGDSGAVIIARRGRRRHPRHGGRDHRRRRHRRARPPADQPLARLAPARPLPGARSTGAPTRTPPSTSGRWCSSGSG